jgi:hypothetical protein
MPRILTTNAQIVCPHGGLGTTVPLDPVWQIDGGFALAEGDAGTLACPFVLYPCVGYTLRSMGLNASQLNGRSVILETDFNQSVTGLPLTMMDFHTVIDDSIPASIPPGADAPPLSPALADMTEPLVVATPPLLVYPTTPAPVNPAIITFTLAADHPNQWVLTLIDTNGKRNIDLTHSRPPDALVVPDGGEWNGPGLAAAVTLSPAFLVELGIGRHEMYMTGVTERGRTGRALVEITIT